MGFQYQILLCILVDRVVIQKAGNWCWKSHSVEGRLISPYRGGEGSSGNLGLLPLFTGMFCLSFFNNGSLVKDVKKLSMILLLLIRLEAAPFSPSL